MESSSLSIIVPIVVGLIIFLIEKASEKKAPSAPANGRPDGRRPVVPVNPQADEAARRAEAARHAALARRRAAARASEEAMAVIEPRQAAVSPVVPSPAPLPEEGARVTADKPVKAHVRARAAVPRVPGGDLRKAIIWSEILKRKF